MLFALMNAKDEKTKRTAAQVLKRLTTDPHNKMKIVDASCLRNFLTLLTDSSDKTLKTDLMQ